VNGEINCRSTVNMTAIPLRQGVEPPLHSLVAQSSTNGINDYEMSENNNSCVEMDSICHSDAINDAVNIKPGIFVTGPESWPANLQLKVT